MCTGNKADDFSSCLNPGESAEPSLNCKTYHESLKCIKQYTDKNPLKYALYFKETGLQRGESPYIEMAFELANLEAAFKAENI